MLDSVTLHFSNYHDELNIKNLDSLKAKVKNVTDCVSKKTEEKSKVEMSQNVQKIGATTPNDAVKSNIQ